MVTIDDFKLYEMEEELNRLRQMIRDIRDVCYAYQDVLGDHEFIRTIRQIIQ